jgi:hypothetical protein
VEVGQEDIALSLAWQYNQRHPKAPTDVLKLNPPAYSRLRRLLCDIPPVARSERRLNW